MNEKIKNFMNYQLSLLEVNHIDKENDCKFKTNYNCVLCNRIIQEQKGALITIDHTAQEFIDLQLSKLEYFIKYYEIKNNPKEQEILKLKLLEPFCEEKNILIFLKTYGSEKSKDIIHTIENIKCYKVTEKMRFCLAKDLLNIIDYNEIKFLFKK